MPARRPKPAKYSTNRPRPFQLGHSHRRFCQLIVEGMPKGEAVLTSGFKTTASAHRLLGIPEIKEEIGKLRAEAKHRHNVTIDRLVDHYYEAMTLARATENAGAYVAAVTAMGKMLGLIVEKTEHDVFLIPKPALRPGTDVLLTPEQWAEQWSPKEIEHKPNGHGNGAPR